MISDERLAEIHAWRESFRETQDPEEPYFVEGAVDDLFKALADARLEAERYRRMWLATASNSAIEAAWEKQHPLQWRERR